MRAKVQASLRRRKIGERVAELCRLARVAEGSGVLVRGSFYAYRRRCGKDGCRCARGQLHPGRAFGVSSGGRSRVVSLRGLDRQEVEAGVKAWRQWRQTRAAMVAVFAELLRELDRLGEALTTPATGLKRRG
jgi:hypothetical protein